MSRVVTKTPKVYTARAPLPGTRGLDHPTVQVPREVTAWVRARTEGARGHWRGRECRAALRPRRGPGGRRKPDRTLRPSPVPEAEQTGRVARAFQVAPGDNLALHFPLANKLKCFCKPML